MDKPSYYAILPANVRYDVRLRPMEKIIYSEITALTNTQGYCFANNSYFAKLYEVDKKTVGVWINNLIKFGYLKSELIYQSSGKEVAERRLYIFECHKKMDTLGIKKFLSSPQKSDTPPHKKVEDTTTSSNSIKVNNINTTTSSSDDIKKLLNDYGVGEQTIKNILKLEVDSKRVELVLRYSKKKNWKDGAIYEALKKNWIIEEEKDISQEELEAKRKWLNYFAGLDKKSKEEVFENIKRVNLEVLEKNKKRLAKAETIFEFKQLIKKL